MKDTGKQRKIEAYAYLKKSILTLEIAPGDDLDETRLCEKLGLSRTPLREVFRQLAGEGYVVIRDHRAPRTSEMSYTTLRDFFLAAPMIYGAVLRLAAVNARPEQIEELKKAQEEFRVSLRSGSNADRALANNRFHEITGEMANNVYLQPSFHRLLIDHARIGMTFYRPDTPEMVRDLSEASDQHYQIIDAIEARDEVRAGQLAEEHWNLSRDQIELFVMPTALDVPMGSLARKTSA